MDKHEFCGFLDKNTDPQYNHEEASDKPKLKSIKVTKDWESPRLEETKEIQRLDAIWNLGLDPRTDKAQA